MFLKYFQKLDDIISYLLASELNEKKFLKNYLKKKEIIIVDIGANEGTYLDFLSSIFHLKKIYCFEPIANLSDKLKANYGNKNIVVYNTALSNFKGSRKFYEYQVSSTSSFYKQNDLYKSLKKIKNVKKISVNKYDNYFRNNKKIDICKIDVQGEDFKVLQGMTKNLKKKCIKLIKVELSLEKFYFNTKETFYDIIFFLKKYNYSLISISKIKTKDQKLTFLDAYFEYKK